MAMPVRTSPERFEIVREQVFCYVTTYCSRAGLPAPGSPPAYGDVLAFLYFPILLEKGSAPGTLLIVTVPSKGPAPKLPIIKEYHNMAVWRLLSRFPLI